MPTYYALACENFETGMPLARRLDFYYPQYEEAKDNSQYLLGKDILVAPFWGTSGDGRDVVPTEWLTTADGEQGLKAAYFTYETTDNRENYCDGTPVSTEIVPTVDFYWYTSADGITGGPTTGVAEDYFAASFTGKITPAYDCYIGVLADECARIFINGEEWVGWKTGQLAQNFNMDTPLKAGVTYDIVVECYEKTGKAIAYLMCEPVLPENTSERTVFIPDGTWTNAFTGEKVVGPQTITVRGGLDEIPIYIREGSAVLTSKVISPMTGADWEDISINLYNLSETSASLYEDDGMSEDYIDGKWRKTDVTVTADGENWLVNIGAASGEFTTDYTSRTVKLRIHSKTPIKASVNGEALPVTVYERDESALPFANEGASNISTVYEITVDAALASTTSISVSQADSGDVNGDGELSVLDMLTALHALLNNKDCTAADMNDDNKLSLLDILALLRAIPA